MFSHCCWRLNWSFGDGSEHCFFFLRIFSLFLWEFLPPESSPVYSSLNNFLIILRVFLFFSWNFHWEFVYNEIFFLIGVRTVFLIVVASRYLLTVPFRVVGGEGLPHSCWWCSGSFSWFRTSCWYRVYKKFNSSQMSCEKWIKWDYIWIQFYSI